MQVVQHFRIGFCQTGRQKVRLLLVVAFEADAIFRPDHRLEQRSRLVCRHQLSRCEFATRGKTFIARSLLALPISHVVWLLLTLPCRLHAADEDSTVIRQLTGFVADETGPYEPQPKFNVAAQMFEARLNLSSDPHSSNRRV